MAGIITSPFSWMFFSSCVLGRLGDEVVFWLITKGCPAPASNRVFFFKLMKICNIDSYYLLRQMVNIFPILVFLHVTAKNNHHKKQNNRKTQENLFLKSEDKRGSCCFKNTLHIKIYIYKKIPVFSSWLEICQFFEKCKNIK